MPTFGAGCAIELWGWLSRLMIPHWWLNLPQESSYYLVNLHFLFIIVFLMRMFLYSDSSCQELTHGKQTKQTQNRLGSTRILTDTPVKNDIAMKKLKKVKLTTAALPGKRTSKKSTSTPGMTISKKSISSKRKLWASTAPSDDANPPCLYCNELFLNSVKEFREWIQCQGNCKKWCHRVCAGKGKEEKYFVCELCFTA